MGCFSLLLFTSWAIVISLDFWMNQSLFWIEESVAEHLQSIRAALDILVISVCCGIISRLKDAKVSFKDSYQGSEFNS